MRRTLKYTTACSGTCQRIGAKCRTIVSKETFTHQKETYRKDLINIHTGLQGCERDRERRRKRVRARDKKKERERDGRCCRQQIDIEPIFPEGLFRKRDLYIFRKRDPYIRKRQQASLAIHRALLRMYRSLLRKRPIHPQKGPMYLQTLSQSFLKVSFAKETYTSFTKETHTSLLRKRPIHPQKGPMYLQKSSRQACFADRKASFADTRKLCCR